MSHTNVGTISIDQYIKQKQISRSPPSRNKLRGAAMSVIVNDKRPAQKLESEFLKPVNHFHSRVKSRQNLNLKNNSANVKNPKSIRSAEIRPRMRFGKPSNIGFGNEVTPKIT